MSATVGLRRIVAFNWPKLAGAGGVVLGGVAAVRFAPAPALGAGVAVAAAYFLVASLAVSWWVYDRSGLHDWRWLRPLLPAPPRRWALVHAGFDEPGPELPALLGPPAAIVDLSPWLGRLSPSLRRARRRCPAPVSSPALGGRLPLASASYDAVVLVFAAHEVRDQRQREALFDELRRVVTPAGRVVLVEHLRDRPNAAAFGPGAWHFQTRGEWLRLAERSGFPFVHEVRQTSFVRGFALCPF